MGHRLAAPTGRGHAVANERAMAPPEKDMASDDSKVQKSPEEWQKQLTPEQYRVTRNKGTEPAFSGKYHDSKQPGVYRCVCCGTELFSSDHKYDSGSGWPSFYKPMHEGTIKEERDLSHGMR